MSGWQLLEEEVIVVTKNEEPGGSLSRQDLKREREGRE